MMESHWQEVDQVLGEVLERPDTERSEYLRDKVLAPEVRRRVLALLEAWNDSDGFLESPVLSLSVPEPDRMIGKRLGAWRLESVIGSGGMGTVYLAERDDQQFDQRAAVKLMAAHALNRPAAQRFREERQILARLEHANIARLIDGGISVDGFPFLVMEYVEGTAIQQWCSEKNLSLEQRLGLFRQVCAAVQYAHQNLIVHCDLKPANILVTAGGQVKLLDFGIARIVDPQRDATAVLMRPMTLDYASPEQIRGAPLTTASDIYSIGILLHELLTGRRPYRLEGKPLDEVLDVVCNREIAKPRTASADLDAIILKALSKDPGQRYSSAAALDADVVRYLEGRPIEARSHTAFYVSRRFAERHWLGVGAVAALTLSVLIGGGLVLRQSRIASHRFESVRQIAHFVIFEMHDAVAPLPGSTPVRKLLVSHGLQYLDELARDATADPSLQLEVATAYTRLGDVSGLPTEPNLGDVPGALRSYRKAADLLEPLYRRRPVDPRVRKALAAVYQDLALIQSRRDTGAALAAVEKLVELQRERARTESRDEAQVGLAIALDTRSNVVEVLGRHDQALRDELAALEIFEALLAKSPADPRRQRNAALGHKKVASGLLVSGQDREKAELHLRRAEELDRQRVHANPGDRSARLDLSFDLSQNGWYQWHVAKNLPAATTLFENALAVREELAKSDPSDARLRSRIGYLHWQLGTIAMEAGQPMAALTHSSAALELDRELYAREASAAQRSELAGSLELSARANDALGRRAPACEAWSQAQHLAEIDVRLGTANPDEQKLLDTVTDALRACKD